jgi:hypothetical protein
MFNLFCFKKRKPTKSVGNNILIKSVDNKSIYDYAGFNGFYVNKGGFNFGPTTPKPDIKPIGQMPLKHGVNFKLSAKTRGRKPKELNITGITIKDGKVESIIVRDIQDRIILYNLDQVTIILDLSN